MIRIYNIYAMNSKEIVVNFSEPLVTLTSRQGPLRLFMTINSEFII